MPWSFLGGGRGIYPAQHPGAGHGASFCQAGKPIAAICHGAQLLAAAGVLAGKSCSAYPAVGPDVGIAGGTFMDIAVDQAHVDGNLVTAPAWPAHPQWLAKFLEVLGTRIDP